MSKVKPCYIEEVKQVIERTSENKGDFRFAVIADTHLDNSLPETFKNIKAVDDKVGFDCMLHLGDFLNGNIPRKYTSQILRDQMDEFRSSINTKAFYPTPGNHDGFYDLIFHKSTDMTIDEDWYKATDFLDESDNIVRPENKQYFFVDYPDKKIRIISLNSFHYKGFSNGERFEKVYGFDKEQIEWVKNTALNLISGWTVMFLSHDMPFSEYNTNYNPENNIIVNGDLMFNVVVDKRKENGFDIAAWFIGHHHGDLIIKVRDINFILVASGTAYVPSLWGAPVGREWGEFFPRRELNTDTEDLWDSVVLDKTERKVKLTRFGAGTDRETSY